MTEPTHAEILGAVKSIEATLNERRRTADMRRKHMDESLGDIKTQLHDHGVDLKEHGERLRKVEKVAAFGEGVGYLALKIGGVIVIIVGALAWLWDRLKLPH